MRENIRGNFHWTIGGMEMGDRPILEIMGDSKIVVKCVDGTSHCGDKHRNPTSGRCWEWCRIGAMHTVSATVNPAKHTHRETLSGGGEAFGQV